MAGCPALGSTWGRGALGSRLRSSRDLCPRPVSRSPYTIMVGSLRSGNTALPWEVETGATGTQALTGAAVWSLTRRGTTKLPLMLGLTTTGWEAGLRVEMTEAR